MTPPPGLTAEALPAVFAGRLARLGRDWASVSDYATFFVQNTAPLLDPADPLLLDYLAHDLDGHRVRLSSGALIADATGIFFGPPWQEKWDQLRTPTRLVTAERSTGPGSTRLTRRAASKPQLGTKKRSSRCCHCRAPTMLARS
jgi:hypothetical protein